MSTEAVAATDRPRLHPTRVAAPLAGAAAGSSVGRLFRALAPLAGGDERVSEAARRRASDRVLPEVANARVRVNRECPDDDSEVTSDPNDMAHGVRYGIDEKGDGLKPAREVPDHAKRPRRYHFTNMCGPAHHRVSFESAIEESESRRRRLLVELGEIPGVTDAYESASLERIAGAFNVGDDVRAIVEPNRACLE